jgi:cell wall-associated NlpC family hydrolase
VRLFKPGDLIFFGSGRRAISHVAISTGGTGFVHAYGYVREGNLAIGHPDFLPDLTRLFRAAARPLEGGKKDVDKKTSFP